METLTTKRAPYSSGADSPPEQERTKRVREPYRPPKPPLMLNHETSTHKYSSLGEIPTRAPVELLSPDFPFPRTLDLAEALEELKEGGQLQGLVLCFYGPGSFKYLAAIERLERALAPAISVVGVSAYVSPLTNGFSTINDSKGLASRCFGTLDPLGGGVYPQDTMILFDSHGCNRLQVAILGGSRGISLRFNTLVVLRDRHEVAYRGRPIVEVGNLLLVVEECFRYMTL